MTKPTIYFSLLVVLPLSLLPLAWADLQTAAETMIGLEGKETMNILQLKGKEVVIQSDSDKIPKPSEVPNSPYGEIITLCTDGACGCNDDICKPEEIAKNLVYHILGIKGPVKKVIDDFMAEEGCILTKTGYRYGNDPDSFSCPRIDLSDLLKLRSGRAGWMYQSISRLVIVRLVELGSASNTFPIMALTICQEMKSQKGSDDNYQTTLATRVCGFDPSRFSLPRPTWSEAEKSMVEKALKHRLDAMEALKPRLDQKDLGEIPPAQEGPTPPVYPRIARESGWEGTVLIRVVVLADGNPGSISVHKSSGHAVLDEAAIEAVKKWKFTPAKDGNIPVRSVVEIPINFDLSKQ